MIILCTKYESPMAIYGFKLPDPHGSWQI